MSIHEIFAISASALGVQAERLTLIAQNLANSDTLSTPEGGPYQRRVPLIETAPVSDSGALGVKVAAVVRDPAPARKSYDPGNPMADASGYVASPAVNPILEMVDLMQAARSYQANVSTLQSAESVALQTLNILKGP